VNGVTTAEPAPSPVAPTANTQTTDDASTLFSKKDGDDEDEKKKKDKTAVLKRLVGRVTLLLTKN
jgi:hypothetical protein